MADAGQYLNQVHQRATVNAHTYCTYMKTLLTLQCESIALCMPLCAVQHVFCEPTRTSTDVSKEHQFITTEDTALQSDTNMSIIYYYIHHAPYHTK